jgi:transcriptional regulator with XRE-family HTH domain
MVLKGKRFPRCHLGKFLKKARIQRGLAQKTIALDLGYKSAQFISNVERGMSLLPPDKIMSLAKLLEIDAKVLIREIEKDQKSVQNPISNL